MLSAAAAVSSTTDRPRIVIWHSQRRQTNCTTLLIDTRRGGGGVRLLLYRVQTYRLWRPNAMIQDLHAVIKSDWNATKAASSRPKRWQIDEGHEILSRSCGITTSPQLTLPLPGGFKKFVSRSHWNPAAVPRDFTAPTPVPFDTLLRKRRVWIYGRFH